jgi:uncharacterized heparinase superfamily protein
MTRRGLSERVQIASARVSTLRRTVASRLLGSSVLRWHHIANTPLPLVIIPQDLRARDPSFWPELESGHFGLSGAVVFLDGHSPFDVEPPNAVWQRDLHGFSWLRHLEASGKVSAPTVARGYVLTWLTRRPADVAAHPAARARRILSWIAHAPFILDGATAAEYDAFMRGLTREIGSLATRWRNSDAGPERLLVLTALVVANLASRGPERRLYTLLNRLSREIERQILPDGGHVSRNPAVLIELLLDWLPLKSCFAGRSDDQPEALVVAISRMLAHLRFLRLGDGGIARFNGMATGDPAGLATLLGYDDRPLPAWSIAPQSRYARLARAATCIVADVGQPPPLTQSVSAHAGCLSFEVSSGRSLLFVNAGAPSPADAVWRAVARATASHSTVCLGEMSSSRLVRHQGLETSLGAVPLQLPSLVTAQVVVEADDGLRLSAAHDGYVERLGITHRREVHLSADGALIAGHDVLETNGDRLKRDVPFALHFHLHPDTKCGPLHDANGLIDAYVIDLVNGQRWVFRASGSIGLKLSLEESTYFVGSSGPRPSLQLVVRGATAGASAVTWSVTLQSAGRGSGDGPTPT